MDFLFLLKGARFLGLAFRFLSVTTDIEESMLCLLVAFKREESLLLLEGEGEGVVVPY